MEARLYAWNDLGTPTANHLMGPRDECEAGGSLHRLLPSPYNEPPLRTCTSQRAGLPYQALRNVGVIIGNETSQPLNRQMAIRMPFPDPFD